MNEASGAQVASFVVRLYRLAPRAGLAPLWYGTVAHVQSSEKLVFRDLYRLNSFIAGHSGISSHLPALHLRPPPWRGLGPLFRRLRHWRRR